MRIDPEVLKYKNPNAWVSQIKELAFFLDLIYSKTKGEIWLFDNDLKVLEDYDDSFKMLYTDRIDGCLASNISSIKILLSPKRYKRFCDKVDSPQLFENLCRLRPERLKTFYVGELNKEIKPTPNYGGDLPWIFYLGKKQLRSRNGVVIVRPSEYPFAHGDIHDDFVVAWHVSDPKTEAMYHRISAEWFHDVFFSNYNANFMSVEPQCDEGNNVIGYSLIPARSERVVSEISSRLTNIGIPPVISPVECAIITTLPEEYQAVLDVFKLDENIEVIGGTTYATGWHNSPDSTLSVVLIQCFESGSVCSATTTAKLIRDWAPKAIFLIGRCGARKENGKNNGRESKNQDEHNIQEGDVIIANRIYPYEYQSIKINEQTGEDEIEYESRMVNTSNGLRQMARALLRTGWKYTKKTDLPLQRKPKAIEGDFACGHKLVRKNTDWFDEMRVKLGARKLFATEMESEGVGWA